MADARPDALSTDAPGAAHEQRAGRRWLLRSGLLAAGAAGVAAVTTAAPAQAADGDPVELGAGNDATSTTTVTVADGAEPALALQNGAGPSLYLQPLPYESTPALDLGQLANTELGPVLGVASAGGQTTTFLATGIDIADLPTPYALAVPVRILDTRTKAGRSGVVRTSDKAFDSAGRLVRGAWMDVEIGAGDPDIEVPAAYLNLTVIGTQARGHAAVYPPGDYPGISTLSWVKGQTVANHTFVATGIALGRYAVRVRVSAATHVVLDLTGVTIRGTSPVPAASTQTKSSARAVQPRDALAGRLRSTLAERLVRRLAR